MNEEIAKRSVKRIVEDTMPAKSIRHHEDEFSLRDLAAVMRRRWLSLAASMLFCLLIALAYFALSAPVFESRASIRIGKIFQINGRLSAVEEIDTLAFQLIAQYGSDRNDDGQWRMPYLKQATKAPGQEILRLVAVGQSPGQAKEFLQQVMAELMERHEEIHSKAMEPLRSGLKTLEQQMARLTAQTAELGKLSDRLKESNAAQASLVAIERGQLLAKLTQLERDYVGQQQIIARPYSSPSEIVSAPRATADPVGPGISVAIAIGVAAGLVLGAIVVLLQESLAKRPAVPTARPSARE